MRFTTKNGKKIKWENYIKRTEIKKMGDGESNIFN